MCVWSCTYMYVCVRVRLYADVCVHILGADLAEGGVALLPQTIWWLF